MTTIARWAARPAAQIAKAREGARAATGSPRAPRPVTRSQRHAALAMKRARMAARTQQRTSAQTYAYNPLQWRNPENGRWIDMPGGLFEKLGSLMDGLGADSPVRDLDAPVHDLSVHGDDFGDAINAGNVDDALDAVDKISGDLDSIAESVDALYSDPDLSPDELSAVQGLDDLVGEARDPGGMVDVLRDPDNIDSLIEDAAGGRPTVGEGAAARRDGGGGAISEARREEDESPGVNPGGLEERYDRDPAFRDAMDDAAAENGVANPEELPDEVWQDVANAVDSLPPLPTRDDDDVSLPSDVAEGDDVSLPNEATFPGERDSGILNQAPAKGNWVRVTDPVSKSPTIGRVTGTRRRGGRQGYLVDTGEYEPEIVFPDDDPNFGVVDRDKMRSDGFGWDSGAGGLGWGRVDPPTEEETDAMTQVEIDELRHHAAGQTPDAIRRSGFEGVDPDANARSWEEWLNYLDRESDGETDAPEAEAPGVDTAAAVASMTRALGSIRDMSLRWRMLNLLDDVQDGKVSLDDALRKIQSEMEVALDDGTIDDYTMGKVQGALDSLTASAAQPALTASAAASTTERDPSFAPETDPYRDTSDPLSLTASSTSATKAPPVAPPAEWFAAPDLDGPTPLTVSDTGRVFGHLATWDTCHIANPAGEGVCVQPPRSASNYAYFHTGAITTANGSSLSVGHLTMDTMHASPTLAAAAAAGHYDNTGLAVADVRCGEDRFGIWVAGALRPATTPVQIRTLRSSPISGDWRRIGGNLELTAALAVNTPGFPIPRPSGLIASAFNPMGTNDENPLQSLTAAGMLAPRKVPSPGSARAFSAEDYRYLKRLLDNERAIERSVLADRAAKAKAAFAARAQAKKDAEAASANREKVAAFAAKRAALATSSTMSRTTPATTTKTTTS